MSPQVTNAARLGTNTFTATQTISTGNLNFSHSTVTTGNITKNDARFLHDAGPYNTFLGTDAGNYTVAGEENTATGGSALTRLTFGSRNTANGFEALLSNTGGGGNTASGTRALLGNAMGHGNTAVGEGSLGAAQAATTWPSVRSAGSLAAAGSDNIYLGANVRGAEDESNTMHLGNQNPAFGVPIGRTFIAGIRGITTASATAVPVLIDVNGQLGTISSSRRFKEDIRDMADTSQRLLQLRPVTFRYKHAYGDGAKPMQFGLVAEEVAEVFPSWRCAVPMVRRRPCTTKRSASCS